MSKIITFEKQFASTTVVELTPSELEIIAKRRAKKDKLVGQEVWCLEYDMPDLQDGDAVFSTREKAIQCLERDFEGCSDIWHNPEVIVADEKFISVRFTLCNTGNGLPPEVTGVNIIARNIE